MARYEELAGPTDPERRDSGGLGPGLGGGVEQPVVYQPLEPPPAAGDEAAGSDLYEEIIDPLARGIGYAAAGALINRSARSVRRRMADEDYARTVKERRREMVGASAGRFTAASDRAVDAILELLSSADPKVRLAAARLVLDMGSRLTDRVEIDELVHKLEERLADPDSGGRRS